ncbi:MAG: DUF1285 domain-containing protein [Deltaproteobacteria bacterium]
MEGRRHTREDSGLRLDREGRFWHDGELVRNARIAEAFHRGLEPGEDGRFVVRFGWDWAFVEVEDAPYQLLGVRPDGGLLVVDLDDGRSERILPTDLRLSEDGILYARVRSGRCDARFTRAAQGQLAPWLEPEGDGFALQFGAVRTRIAARGSAGRDAL